MASIRIINSNKNNFKKDLIMKNNYNFKPFDMVLVRDYDHETWKTNLFKSKKICGKDVLYYCISDVWNQCIPYEGNEHLLGTTDTPDRYNLDKNTLFGVKLKPGYVLELEDDEVGILFPTANGFAISYVKGYWQSLDGIKKDTIVKIFGIAKNGFIRSGKLLWKRPNPKTIFTKAKIAEKLKINVDSFEIID